MKRVFLLLFLLMVPVLLITFILAVELSDPPAWQIELDKYMVYKGAVLSGTLETRMIDRGAMPWHFSQIMSEAAFGENPHFDTDYGYDGKISPGGSTALPFPPESLWCALLAAETPSPSPSTKADPYVAVVIIAEHQDLSDSAFIVHEVASDHLSLADSLALVGCWSIREEIQFDEAGRWV